jgi:hypothetical protein
MFRMAHTERPNSVCVLVQADGQYHLERQHRRNVQVFEGTLSDDRLARLKALLGDSSFRQLSQEAVSSSLLPTGLDELVISVPRQERWMNLRFLSGVSGDRNRPLLDQFLKWNDGVLKDPHKKLSEESAKNNCLPPGEVELKTRSD